MSITREQVADLQPGDLVTLARVDNPQVKATGELFQVNGHLYAGPYLLRYESGDVAAWTDEHTLTVVSRTLRPLYVNHNRARPVLGDLVRDADGDDPRVWLFADPDDEREAWATPQQSGGWWVGRKELPDRLRLLVDGETGQVVP